MSPGKTLKQQFDEVMGELETWRRKKAGRLAEHDDLTMRAAAIADALGAAPAPRKRCKNCITKANMEFLKLELERLRSEKARPPTPTHFVGILAMSQLAAAQTMALPAHLCGTSPTPHTSLSSKVTEARARVQVKRERRLEAGLAKLRKVCIEVGADDGEVAASVHPSLRTFAARMHDQYASGASKPASAAADEVRMPRDAPHAAARLALEPCYTQSAGRSRVLKLTCLKSRCRWRSQRACLRRSTRAWRSWRACARSARRSWRSCATSWRACGRAWKYLPLTRTAASSSAPSNHPRACMPPHTTRCALLLVCARIGRR